jgi:hypothetical protein
MNTIGTNVYEPIVERLSSGLNDGEEPPQFIGHGRQFAFDASAGFSAALAGLDAVFVALVLGGLVDVAEDRQQEVELGLRHAGQGSHLASISDNQCHR